MWSLCPVKIPALQHRPEKKTWRPVECNDVFSSCAEKIKICLIFSKILFTICARDSFILGQQMAFFEM